MEAAASLRDQLARLHQQRVAAARVGINTFIELVMRDEQSGAPVKQAAMHRRWHELIDAESRLVIMAHIEAAKTSQVSVARVLWELGRNPNLRCAIVSNTHGQASKILRSVSAYVEKSPEVREVFPDLRPASPWTDSAITVERQTISKDPSAQCFGVHGAIIGSRIDLLVVDDVTDYENSRTEAQRKELVAWVDSAVLGRLTAGGRCIVVGTAYHPEDLLHVLAGRGWPCHRFPVEDEQGLPRWPERWPKQRIDAKRLELGPAEAARQLDVQARSDAEARFKLAWIDTALQRGAGKTCPPYLLSFPTASRVVTGVDLAVSKASSADLTAFITVLVHANGDRQLLNVESGRWAGPEIIDRIVRIHRRYGGTVVVESVAAQAYISHFVRGLGGIPVRDFRTGRARMSLEWQCETLAAEMARGQWVIPSDNGRVNNPEVAALLRDLLFYNPGRHVPDRVAAACFARWGAEQGERRAEVGRVDLLTR